MTIRREESSSRRELKETLDNNHEERGENRSNGWVTSSFFHRGIRSKGKQDGSYKEDKEKDAILRRKPNVWEIVEQTSSGSEILALQKSEEFRHTLIILNVHIHSSYTSRILFDKITEI